LHTLITPRLRLRPLRRTDFRILQSLYGDPELMHFITGRPRTPWQTRARLKKDLSHHRTHGFGLCLGELKADDHIVGRFGLVPRESAGGMEGELAWMVTEQYRGRGLATEAGSALIRFGLRELGLSRVFAVTHPQNTASLGVMERLGMTLVAGRPEELEYEVA
jgi:RimJ/RimL family protein N-acetyltransferase